MVLDGKIISDRIKGEIAEAVIAMRRDGHRAPHLAAILVGDDGASQTYVASKERSCAQVGFDSTILRFPDTISQQELLTEINMINMNESIDGLIIQLPLPKHIDENAVIGAVDYRKDVDGFHPINIGNLMLGTPTFVPATPMGIMELLKRYKIDTAGKHCVVVGRSNIVGKPMANLLVQKSYPGNCTVTICHSRTPNIDDFTRLADILVVAIGDPLFLKADMVKDGAVVIDVGITRCSSSETKSGFKLIGDVDYEAVAPKSSYITPVPGGVGPMTIVALLMNTLVAAKRKLTGLDTI